MPTSFAASSTFVPAGATTVLPSIVRVTGGRSLTGSSSVEFARDDVQGAEDGHEVRDHLPAQELVVGGEGVEAGRPHVEPVGLAAAVGAQPVALLAVGRLGVGVDLADRRREPV